MQEKLTSRQSLTDGRGGEVSCISAAAPDAMFSWRGRLPDPFRSDDVGLVNVPEAIVLAAVSLCCGNLPPSVAALCSAAQRRSTARKKTYAIFDFWFNVACFTFPNKWAPFIRSVYMMSVWLPTLTWGQHLPQTLSFHRAPSTTVGWLTECYVPRHQVSDRWTSMVVFLRLGWLNEVLMYQGILALHCSGFQREDVEALTVLLLALAGCVVAK